MTKKILLLINILLVFKFSGAENNSINFLNGTPPIIFNFRIEASEPNRIYFDSDKIITGSNTNGFTVSNKTISGITINDGQLSNHYFTISSSFSYWDNNTIRYEGGSNIRDNSNNDLIEFTLSYIENNIPEPDASTNRYVTTSASGGGDGTSESSAWTLSEAFSRASAGMTVWIKAGNYGNQNLSIYNDGTSRSPIKFIGYKNSIGDITSNYFDYGVSLSSSEMPTLTGSSAFSGQAITLMNTNYVVFRNLQITNYHVGIRANNTVNSNLIFDRINGQKFGGSGNSHSYFIWLETFRKDGSLRHMSNNNMKILDSRCINADMAAIYVQGEGSNLIDGCKTYADKTVGSELQDYHISVNGHNSIIRNCHSENFNSVNEASSHGIGIRGSHNLSNTYNLIEKSTAVNLMEGFYIRNYGCDYNVIKDCKFIKKEVSPSIISTWRTGGVWIWGGANYNTIERVTVDRATFGLAFFDNQEEANYSGHDIGNNNIIRNCTFNENKFSVYVSSESSSAQCHDNKVINCTFNNGQYFYTQKSSDVKNMEFINCIITDQGLNSSMGNLSFSYSNFYNNKNNWVPNGEENTNLDPRYLSSSDLRLSSSSPSQVTDGGKTLAEVRLDMDSKKRNAPYSMGAYEYGDNTTGFINADAGEDTEICKGFEAILNASGGSEYLWNTGETTASITVSPDETTTYTVTVSDGENSQSDDVIVTVTAPPSVSLGDDIVECPGNEVTLIAEGTGNFLWNTGETSPSITVNPTETTEYIVTASSACGNETLSVSDTIKVNITSDITLNAGEDVTACSGTQVTLTAESNGDFLWSTGETTASITVNPTETTTYSVSSTSGTCTVTDEVIVTISEQPEITLGDDLSICSGNEVTLTAQGKGDFLWSTGETSSSISVNPTETTEYIVTASSLCGEETLSVSDTLVVTVIPVTTLDAGKDITVCSGTEVTLTAEGNGTFLWSTGETTASIVVNPTETTSYTVTSGSGDCEITDEVVVSISEQPEVTLGDDISICSGNEITLTAQGKGDFLWSNGETSPSISVSPTETTEYIVTATSVCGGETLSVSDTIVVNVTQSITLNAGDDVSICSGTEVTLTADGNGTFLWNTGETTASIIVNPTETTTYAVTSGSGDCEITDEVIVTVGNEPIVSLGDNISVCSGTEVTLTAEGTGNFLWSTGETTTSITVNPTETTEYVVTASSSCGNETLSVSDTLVVNVTPSVTLDAGEDLSICLGNEITLTAEGNGSFLWSTGETTASIVVSPTETRTYSVTSGSGDCKITDEVSVTVEQLPSVNLGEDVTICYDDYIVLTAEGTGNFLWSTGETTETIRVKPLETTIYTVTSSNSCSNQATDSITVNVGPQIFVNAGEDKTICIGEAVTLIAEGNGAFLWSTGETTASITVNA